MLGVALRSALTDTTYQGRAYLVAKSQFHVNKPFTPERTIRNARYKLIHSLRTGAVQQILGVDDCTAYFISRQPEYAGTAIHAAFGTYAKPPVFELYDLASDPIAFHNLTANPRNQNILNERKTALMAWRKATNDSFLVQDFVKKYLDFSSLP